MRALPDITVVAPTSLWEVTEATKAIVARKGTCYLRLDKDVGPDFADEDASFTLGRARWLRRGQDIAFLVSGGILSEVVEAAKILEEDHGFSASIISVHTLSPLEPTMIVEAARHHRALVTVEEHTLPGGLGTAVLEVLANEQIWPERFTRVGLANCFSSAVGSQKYLRKVYEMDAAAIVRKTKELLS